MITHGASPALGQPIAVKRRPAWLRIPHVSLTVRLITLVLIAVCPAIVIQAYNEYELRKASETDIRQQVIQITKQFGRNRRAARRGSPTAARAVTTHTRKVTRRRRLQCTFRVIGFAVREL